MSRVRPSELKRAHPEKAQYAQLESDNESFDEENELTKVKIGRVPYGWYDELKHFGYDSSLNKVSKQKESDKIGEFIRKS